MATLVLTVVGGMVGGPVGAALGAAIGQQVDRQIFAPKGRSGPRLGDLSVQSSTYGAAIPKLYGRVRVAGSVIWATDLVETRRKVSSGKGQPKTTVYSYAANFAVALSSRPVAAIGRIWADGKLLRGASGDFKTACTFRFYAGDRDQPVDPLISALENAGEAPAYRGLAYAVFEDFALEEYGNRIPSLSFEVLAEDTPVSVGQIAADLSDAAIVAGPSPLLDGLAATGDNVATLLATLQDALPFRLSSDDGLPRLASSGFSVGDIAATDFAERVDDGHHGQSLEREDQGRVPAILALRYNDADRDYQPGLQRSMRGSGRRQERRIDLPATLSADRARGLVESLHAHVQAAETSMRVPLPWKRLDLAAGQDVRVANSPHIWRIAAIAFEGMVLQASLVRVSEAAAPSANGAAGRPTSEADVPHGPTSLMLVDLPPLGDVPATRPTVAVLAAGPMPGWRRASLLVSLDGGQSWLEDGATAAPAIIGTCVNALGPGSACIADRINSLDVSLLNDSMILADADDAALRAGANLAMVGDELLQFGRAVPLGGNSWRLSVFLRGRRGTEAAVTGHGPGENFAMIEPDSFRVLDIAPDTQSVQAIAAGIGDVGPPEPVSLLHPSRAIRPLVPCHVRQTDLPGGIIRFDWIRRSRDGWRWPDLVDAPLVEEAERYAVQLSPDAGQVRRYETGDPSFTYDADMRAIDVLAGATEIHVEIAQMGTFGNSDAVSRTILL